MQAPVKRMQAIQEQLRGDAAGEEAVAQQEALLEELVEIVENIDFARGAPCSCCCCLENEAPR